MLSEALRSETAVKPGALGTGLYRTTRSWAYTGNELVIDVR